MRGCLPDGHAVAVMDAGKDGAGVDDIADITGADGVEDLFASFAWFVPDPRADAVLFQYFARQRGGFDIEAHVVEPTDQRHGFFFIFISHADHDGTIVFQGQAGSDQRFEGGPVQLIVVADGFPGGLHFRRKVSVHTPEFGERKGGALHVVPVLFFRIPFNDPLFPQGYAQNGQGADVRQAVAGGFG